jgi:phosphotransferase system IIB component
MRLKRKIPSFVFGVTIGLVIGSAFFIFKINDLFDRVRLAASDQITVIQQPVKVVDAEKDHSKKDGERFKINLGKKSKIDYKEVDSLLQNDESIIVATDELLSVRSVKVIQIGANTSGSDSLAAKLANVEESSANNLYFVEFWKTPLNSKGYRFTRNKVMLYGFSDFTNAVLYSIDNSFYLKSGDQVYRLFYSPEFKKLERVVDNDLLAKIN